MTLLREPVEIIPVQGTSAWINDPDPKHPRNWWRPGSPLALFLELWLIVFAHPEDPFVWTTQLAGWRFWRRWFRKRDDVRDWRAGGKALRWWLVAKGIPLWRRRFWVHSHGLQVLLEAAAEWHEEFFAEVVVSFGSPLRQDGPWREALPKIKRWLIVTDDDCDLTQLLGRIGDGALGGLEEQLRDRFQILRIADIGHSKLLQEVAYFDQLVTRGIVAFTCEGSQSDVQL